jgi:acetyl esterase/lipase
MAAPSPYTTSVAQSTHDGSQTWDGRSGSAFGFTDSVPFPPVMHQATSTRRAHFFIFRVDGVEQGRQINSARLRLWSGNPWTLTSRTYIAVENNLDPAGTGAPTSGQASTGLWTRLGRQAAAVTAFGFRCGPTHTGNLSTAGRTVRDTDAYVYKAFADGRSIPTVTQFFTDDFAGALQALVNDPGWNSTTQYVMIHMFTDSPSAGTTHGIGDLSGITWASGQTGSSAGYEGTNGTGQLRTYDYTSGTIGVQAPQLVIEHESSLTSIPLNTTFEQTSSGRVRLLGRKTSLVAQWRGLRTNNPYTPRGLIPGVLNGAGDTPLSNMVAKNPQAVDWTLNNGPRISEGNMACPSGRSIVLESYLGASVNFEMPLLRWPSPYEAPLTRYSARFYWRIDAAPFSGMYPVPIFFQNKDNTTQGWSLWLNHGGASDTWSLRAKIRNPDTSDVTSWGANDPRLLPTVRYRYEIQVDETRDPKVRVRIYRDDGSTNPIIAIQGNPNNVSATHVGFGQVLQHQFDYQNYGDIEVHADYDLGGEFQDPVVDNTGTPYVPKNWDWFEKVDEDNYQVLEDLGSITAIEPNGTGVVLDSYPLDQEDDNREVWINNPPPYTFYPNVSYATGSRRVMDLWVPNGTPPTGGWPVFMWIHGGFFTGGQKSAYPQALRDLLILNGYAFASVEYVLAAIEPDGVAYPAWSPSANTARYPSYLICAKLAGKYLQGTGATVYSLNPSKQVISGHSAGGYIALAAFASRGVTSDGSGRNLTLAGNLAFGGSSIDTDPQWKGCYSFCGPVSMDLARAYDPTHPNWPILGYGGNMYAASRSFMGRNQGGSTATPHTDIPHIMQQAIDLGQTIPPIAYSWGESDYLVHWEHPELLEEACNDLGVDLDLSYIPNVGHEALAYPENDIDHVLQFVKRVFRS